MCPSGTVCTESLPKLLAAIRDAELAATSGSALATRQLRRVRAARHERSADAPARALAEHVRALADELG
jgi:hypothetical protein